MFVETPLVTLLKQRLSREARELRTLITQENFLKIFISCNWQSFIEKKSAWTR